jgi:hypothetical protein
MKQCSNVIIFFEPQRHEDTKGFTKIFFFVLLRDFVTSWFKKGEKEWLMVEGAKG